MLGCGHVSVCRTTSEMCRGAEMIEPPVPRFDVCGSACFGQLSNWKRECLRTQSAAVAGAVAQLEAAFVGCDAMDTAGAAAVLPAAQRNLYTECRCPSSIGSPLLIAFCLYTSVR